MQDKADFSLVRLPGQRWGTSVHHVGTKHKSTLGYPAFFWRNFGSVVGYHSWHHAWQLSSPSSCSCSENTHSILLAPLPLWWVAVLANTWHIRNSSPDASSDVPTLSRRCVCPSTSSLALGSRCYFVPWWSRYLWLVINFRIVFNLKMQILSYSRRKPYCKIGQLGSVEFKNRP